MATELLRCSDFLPSLGGMVDMRDASVVFQSQIMNDRPVGDRSYSNPISKLNTVRP